MKIFLTTANDYGEYDPVKWLQSNDVMEPSLCTRDPALADLIIFVELHHEDDPYFRNVLKHKLFKKYRHKSVLYHDSDLCITPLPTLSPSVELWQYDPRHKRTFHYIARATKNETIDESTVNYPAERDYLYSFIGSKNHPAREKILGIHHPTDTFIKDTSGKNAWELNKTDKIIYEREYLKVMNASSFILAPRGIGPCSYRLFESMQIGRVPVIIADAWVNIPHIDWDKFAIRVPESQIQFIPSILRERRNEALEMGRLARKYWEENFSPGVSLHQLAIAANELLEHRYSFMDSVRDYSQFIRSAWHFRNLLRYKKNQLTP